MHSAVCARARPERGYAARASELAQARPGDRMRAGATARARVLMRMRPEAWYKRAMPARAAHISAGTS
eukprot:3279261-Alexandrium_andersonii.AAC.1